MKCKKTWQLVRHDAREIRDAVAETQYSSRVAFFEAGRSRDDAAAGRWLSASCSCAPVCRSGNYLSRAISSPPSPSRRATYPKEDSAATAARL